jgi:hypothetical protein
MKFLSTFLMLCFALSINAQQIVCLNTPTNFNTNLSSNKGVTWNVKRTLDNVLENGAVANLRIANQSLSFGTSLGSADAVTITFTKAGNYTITATCKRGSGLFGWGTSTTDVTFVVSVHLAQPEIQFVSLDGSQCLNPSVFLKVKEPQAGVNYVWSPGGQTGTQISTNASSVIVTASSSVCTNTLPRGSIGFVPPIGSFGPGALSIFGISNPCIENPDDGFFSVGGGNINVCSAFSWTVSGPVTILSGTNQSSLQVQFTARGQFATISVTVTNFPNTVFAQSVTKSFQCVTLTNSDCQFLFKDPTGGGTESSALKAKVVSKGSATLFPNPVSEVLQLKELQDYDNLRVIDQYGKVLNTQPIVEGETAKSLNVSQFANGLYLIQFINKTGEVTTKKFQVLH